MKIVNKLTLRHLKENKGRTIITTLGICVSVAMITAVFVAVASFMQLFGDVELLAKGYSEATFTVTQTQLEQLKQDDRIERVGVNVSESSNAFKLENGKTNKTSVGNIYTGDKVNLEQMFTCDYEGTIPQNENEIAVEQSLIDENNLDWKIGDTVSIPLGYRYTYDEDLGGKLVLGGSYISGEEFQYEDIAEFKITAILKDNQPTSQYNIVRGYDLSSLNLAEDETVNAYIELSDVNYKSLDVLNEIVKAYQIKDYEINANYLQTKFAIDKDSSLFTSIMPMALIVLVIIMIASIVLIYNAFAMSLAERVRYLGMLASVGATKKQKQLSIYYESFILGAVGIPIGIVAGIAGIGVTLKVIGKKIMSTGMILGVSDANMSMKVVVPFWVIIGIVFFSVLTIFISCVIPSRKASRITPIDAIRQNNEIKVKAGKLKSPKIVRLIFGYEGELAYKNLKRNGRKSRVITASIALSVILFLSCNYFCDAFTREIDMEVEVPYQITFSVNYDEKENYYNQLDNLADVDDYYCVSNSAIQLAKAGDNYESLDNSLVNKEFLTSTYKTLFNSKKYMYINTLDDEMFNQLCDENNIDYNDYYGDTIKLLLLNNISHKTTGADVFNDKILGNEFDYSDTKLTIGDFVKYNENSTACKINPSGTLSFYVPESVWRNIFEKDMSDDDIMVLIGVETTQHENVTQELYDLLEENGDSDIYVQDFVDTLQAMNTLAFVLEVFVYGFIVLISLITIANIINTITTGIAMRKKEFAMLKSVGTTPKGFNKMIALESALYGIKALVFAIPISLLVSFGMNKALADDTIPFEINYILYLIVIAVVFAIIGLSMIYSVRRLRNDNIVETLKEEIN